MIPILVLSAALGLSGDNGELPRWTAVLEPDYPADSEDFAVLFGAGCSLGCALDWSFAATSTLAPCGGITYGISNIDDISPSTAWAEGADGPGIHECIAILFSDYPGTVRETGAGVNFNGMTIQNGYARDEATWSANGRVRELVLYLDSEPVGIVELLDSMRPQSVYWTPPLYVAEGDVFRLEILSVYEGDLYDDTALSGMMLWGAH
jgi:hypothetical protein